jgi:hypothetical protein
MIDVPKTRAALERAANAQQGKGVPWLTDPDLLRVLSAALGLAQTGLFINEAGQHVRGVWLPLDTTSADGEAKPAQNPPPRSANGLEGRD